MKEVEFKDPTKKTLISQVIFILIIVYAVSSINVLLLALGVIPYLPSAYLNPYMILSFAVTSFVLTTAMAVFHLSTMLRRNKRITDRMPGPRAD
jgi:Na+/phosphate symporter